MTIGRKMGLEFGVVLALVVTLAVVVMFNVANMNRQFSFVIEHDAPVIANARHLSKLVVDMETGQRGFVITGEDEFLEPYDNALASFANLLNEEKALVSDNPAQVRLLERIDASVQEWQKKAAEPEMRARRKMTNRPESMRSIADLLKAGTGKQILDRIRGDFRVFIEKEERLMAARFSSAEEAYARTTTTTILVALVSVIFGGFIATRITRGITKPVRRLAGAVEMVARGDLSQEIESTTGDEIGDLSRSFNLMVGDLKRLEEDREREVAVRKRGEAELRAAETRSRTLLEGSPVCNKIIDLDSRLQYMSAAGARQLKIADIESLYGCPYPPTIFPEAMRAALIEHLERAKAGETCSVECPVLDAEGTELWYHTTFVPVRNDDGQVEYIIGASMEITARKRAERDLLRAKEVAEAATRTKSEFLANMSHEIRTPMTAVLGFAENLLDGSLSESERINCAHTIRRNGEALLGIINDILDLSKVEAGKMTVERRDCRPCRIIAEVASLMRVRADAKGLLFDIEYIGAIPESIQSDPARLRQILSNVIGNAIKFTETGTVRLVARFVDYGDAPHLQFDVIDTGRGMTQEQVAKLFQPFTQADNSITRKFGGTGLGLTISKRFAELLGGDINVVATDVGFGTTFRATVGAGSLDGVAMLENPMSATVVAKAAGGTAHVASSALPDLRILLAEDSPTNRVLVVGILENAGARVTAVKDGKLALDGALAARDDGNPFDVILMDMQMPIMDGYEATGQLRQKSYAGPIIALTAHAMASDCEKCLNAGCDDYATKPIDRNALIETIRRHVVSSETTSPASV